jgi:hypothetical protein
MMITQTCTEVAASARRGFASQIDRIEFCGHSTGTDQIADTAGHRIYRERRVNTGEDLAAPQGFEPRYADPESAVLPLNEGAVS